MVHYMYIGVIHMFMGEYSHTIDAKGRLIVPAKFREHIVEGFILTCGMDGCLFAYPLREWEAFEQKLRSLPVTKKDARAFTRFFFSGAASLTVDQQGRMNIPSPLIQYAQIQKMCTIIGVSNRFEVWATEKWESYYEESEQSFNALSETLFDFDL